MLQLGSIKIINDKLCKTAMQNIQLFLFSERNVFIIMHRNLLFLKVYNANHKNAIPYLLKKSFLFSDLCIHVISLSE